MAFITKPDIVSWWLDAKVHDPLRGAELLIQENQSVNW